MKHKRSKGKEGGASGYMTLSLTLILAAALPLIMMMLNGARKNGARLDAANAYDAGMDAILSEYHRELLEQYDVFFVDLAYGQPGFGPKALENRARYYMNGNFKPEGNGLPSFAGAFYRMNAAAVKLNDVSMATDKKGLVFRRQAEDYIADLDMLDFLPAGDVKKNSGDLDKGRYMTDEVTRRRNENQAWINSIPLPTETDDEGHEHTVELDNPADGMSDVRAKGWGGSGFLPYVTNLGGVSHARLKTPGGPASKRPLNEGDGLNPELHRGDEGLLQRLEFYQYIAMKASNFTNHQEKNAMKYQMEYILNGEEDDFVNLRKTVTTLTLVREMANMIYIFSDSGKEALCKSWAVVLAAVMLTPELVEPVTKSLMFAWAFAESLNDVKILLTGARLPLEKRANTWRTGLHHILTPYGLPGGAGNASGGLNYTEYLIAMIALQDLDTVTMRMLDMVECDIRKTPGNTNFYVDHCADSFDVTAIYKSNMGDSFEENRRYGYP